MNLISNIDQGEYQLNSSMKIKIEETINFYLGENYVITGENGVGKSTFINKLLVPNAIKNSKNNFLIFYASQDFTIQYYIAKYYYNGLLFGQNDFTSVEKVIAFLKTNFINFKSFPNRNIVFIVDEIDQYTPLE